MSGGDFIGRAEAQRCRARGIEDRAGFVADLRAVLAATDGSDVPAEIPYADIAPLIERRMPVQECHLIALYGPSGGKLLPAFGVRRVRGPAAEIQRALEKGAARALARKPTPDPSRLREGSRVTTAAGAASFPRVERGGGGEGAELDTPHPPADEVMELLAGNRATAPPSVAGTATGQTGEAVVPRASPTQTPAVEAGAATAPLVPAAAGEGAAGAKLPPPANFGPGAVLVPDGGAAASPAIADAQADLRRRRGEWLQVWEQATAEALAARGRIDVIERALAALEAVAA